MARRMLEDLFVRMLVGADFRGERGGVIAYSFIQRKSHEILCSLEDHILLIIDMNLHKPCISLVQVT